MPKFASLSYYEDKELTRKLDPSNIVIGRNVDLFQKQTKTFWMYNVGNTRIVKIKLTPSDERLIVAESPTELLPQEKASVTLEWTPREEKDLKVELEITGVYRGK